MNIKRFLFSSLLVCAVLALTLRLFAKPASARPVFDSGSYEEIDAYIEKQLDALNIPGASLAIVEGDQIVHVKGFGVSGPNTAMELAKARPFLSTSRIVALVSFNSMP